MPRTYVCNNVDPRNRHTFEEGTDEFTAAMAHPANQPMKELLWCSRCGAGVGEKLVPERGERYALVTLVADVSDSMFETLDIGNGTTTTRIAQVTDSLADVLRDLALPLAGTAKSLLVAILTFGSRAHWLDVRDSQVAFSNQAQLLTASELVERLLKIGAGRQPPPPLEKEEEIRTLRAALTQAFRTAGDLCGQGTDYSAAMNACGRLLTIAQDDTRRSSLRSSWKSILDDSNRLRYLRTIFYSDGAPTAGILDSAGLTSLSRAIFPDDHTPLIVSSFVGSGAGEAATEAEALLRDISSTCPVHKKDRCMFPGEAARRFRDIIRMASGGAGFCPRCLPRRG